MINLLPTDVKQNIIYARRNTKLRHWIGIFIISIAGVGVITVLGLFYMRQNINDYSDQIKRTQQELQAQQLEATQKQVEDITGSLKLAVQVLSREILFSSLIKQVAASMPTKTVLTDLSISKTTGGIDLSAAAKDYNTATQVQVNLQDPANKIFDKADIVSISCSKPASGSGTSGTTSSISSKYPCAITVRAQFAKSNPYQFINPGVKK